MTVETPEMRRLYMHTYKVRQVTWRQESILAYRWKNAIDSVGRRGNRDRTWKGQLHPLLFRSIKLKNRWLEVKKYNLSTSPPKKRPAGWKIMTRTWVCCIEYILRGNIYPSWQFIPLTVETKMTIYGRGTGHWKLQMLAATPSQMKLDGTSYRSSFHKA